jgi:hypothetical protein
LEWIPEVGTILDEILFISLIRAFFIEVVIYPDSVNEMQEVALHRRIDGKI